MTNAVLTHSPKSKYDDHADRYHFPRTYLTQVKQALGDWIVYYEPRRDAGPASTGGRQSYFALARVDRIEPDLDPLSPNHFYAYVSEYVEFDNLVPFKTGDRYFESALVKADGSTNKGAFGRSVRLISELEFAAIVVAGFPDSNSPWDRALDVPDEVPEFVGRRRVTQILTRPFRDAAFRRQVRRAYDNTCAVTGVRLVDREGRPEVQAAHIRPVEENGPDTVRNGIALTGTFHWMFDCGLISFDDSFRILLSPQGAFGELAKLVPVDRRLRLPLKAELRPHPTYLQWHRRHRFKG